MSAARSAAGHRRTPGAGDEIRAPLRPSPAGSLRPFAACLVSPESTLASLPLFPLFVMIVLALGGLFGLAAARAARRREAARVAHAATLDPVRIPGLHDHLLRTAIDLYGERELARGRERVECAVVLRDRLDAVEGRPSGALNRSRLRARLLPGAHRLRGWPPPQRVRDYLEQHTLAASVAPDPEAEAEARRLLDAGG